MKNSNLMFLLALVLVVAIVTMNPHAWTLTIAIIVGVIAALIFVGSLESVNGN